MRALIGGGGIAAASAAIALSRAGITPAVLDDPVPRPRQSAGFATLGITLARVQEIAETLLHS